MTRRDFDVRGRTVFITGAARGIGAGAATRLHGAGANVVLVDREAVRLELLSRRLGERATWFAADVTDAEQIERAAGGAIERFGGIDVAVANAGVGHVGALASASPESVERTIAVNLLGAWRTDRAVLDQIVARRGYLLNVASLAAAIHTPANGAYAASKAGLEALTDALRVELAASGARVGCAYFGYIETDLERESVTHPAIRALQRTMPGFVRRPSPPSLAVDAIERAIRRRAARVYAPRWVGGALALRGVLQPFGEWRATRDRDLMASILMSRDEGAPHQ
jgi:NAD(P)-dependent dehydrogenase (short-subunit alcohol dehydrogenase family)